MAGDAPRTAADARPQDRGEGALPVRRPGRADQQELHQRHDHPGALPQGRHPCRRRPRADHQPPGPFHHRNTALQRQGTDDAVRAAGLARPPQPRIHPALRQDHPEHPRQGLQRRRLLRPQRPHHRGPRRPRRRRQRRRRHRRALAALRPGPRVSAATPSSNNAPTAWPAPAATSTHPSNPAKANSCKRKRTFSACSSASRSPTTSKQPSRMVRPHSTNYCSVWQIFRHRPGRHPEN